MEISLEKIEYLYYDCKMSTLEIANDLKVSPGKITWLMRKNNLPRRSIRESGNLVFEKRALSFSIKDSLTKDEELLKMAGVYLYWAEGAKTSKNYNNCTVDFANSDPEMIQIFLKFLRNICNVDKNKLRVYLYSHSDKNIKNLLEYWNKITKIPLEQFTKPYIRKNLDPKKSEKMEHGLIHIRYNDKKLLLVIENWIKEYSSKFLKG